MVQEVRQQHNVVSATKIRFKSASRHHTNPVLNARPRCILLGHLQNRPIEFDDINRQLREATVEKPRERASAQADNQHAVRVPGKDQTRREDAGVRQLQMPRVFSLHHALEGVRP